MGKNAKKEKEQRNKQNLRHNWNATITKEES